MNILTKYIAYEEKIKGSRFLSELFPCESQAAARDILKSQKQKYADATHVVHAFICGKDGQIMGCSDDGEPSGTAGRPALDVLKGSGCTNLMLTVTRWFGGTLLGTGGLVQAYSGGTKGVVVAARDSGLFEPLIEKSDFLFDCDYNLYKIIKITLGNFQIFDLKEDFATQVSISGKIAAVKKDELSAKLVELSNGKIKI